MSGAGRAVQDDGLDPHPADDPYGEWGDDLRRLFDEITALRIQRRRLLDRIRRLEGAAPPLPEPSDD